MRPIFGLRAKAILIVIALVILVSVVVTGFFIGQETRLIEDMYLDRGVALSRNLAYNSEFGILTGNKTILKNLAEGVVEQPHVIYCVIRDMQGDVLALQIRPGLKMKPTLFTKAVPDKMATFKKLKTDGVDFFDVNAFVFGAEKREVVSEEDLFLTQEEWLGKRELDYAKKGTREKIGLVSVGISLEAAKGIVARTERVVFRAVFLLTVFLSVISAIGISFFINPIRQMALAIKKVSTGDLETKVLVRSADELGILAQAFNRMSEDLKNTTVSRDYFDNIIRSLTDAMIIFSPDGKIMSVNDAACRLLGYEKEEISGRYLSDFLSQHTVSKLGLTEEGFVRFIHEAQTGPYEITFITKHEERVPILFSVSEVFDKEGNLEEIIGIGKDISKIRETEEELKNLNEQLRANEKAVLNILSDLKKSHDDLESSQEQLLQSEKLASLGRLVSDMAHEVNNPLQIISGRAQLGLMDGAQKSEIEENMNIIMDQCLRAKDIIQRLLMFSKPSRGERKVMDIHDVMEFVAKLIEHQLSLSRVKLVRDYPKEELPVEIDEKQVHEVIMNLIRNSADAMPEEGGTITIKTSRDKGMVRIDISDTGTGIKEEDIKKIFDPFFTTKEHGTGLGLSVCYGIIKSHGGELKYSSKAGEGTTATILLPAKA
jgi:PAS domain S-box-containing protein